MERTYNVQETRVVTLIIHHIQYYRSIKNKLMKVVCNRLMGCKNNY